MPSPEFIRFIATGGTAAIVNVVSRYALSFMLSYQISIVIAYLIGMTTAFALAKWFVFAQSGRSSSNEYIRFALVNVVALIQVWAVSMVLDIFIFPMIGWEWNAQTLAHIIGVASPVITSYYGHKLFTFSKELD
jgi:putative flippase GtrA